MFFLPFSLIDFIMIPLEKTSQVWGICGNLGGGKTLTAVSMAVEAIRSGYFVVSNV